MVDMLRGNPPSSCTVLKDSGAWKYCKNECKKSTARRAIIALNAVVKQVWKEFTLKFIFKSVKHTKGSDGWQMCPIQSPGQEEDKHLKYGGDDLDLASVEKIPFMYLPLSVDTLPVEKRGPCGTEMPCYLVVVTQMKVSE